MSFFDCPKCLVRTASKRGCGICGMRAPEKYTPPETVHREMLVRTPPQECPTLLDALMDAAASGGEKEASELVKYCEDLAAYNARMQKERT